MNLSELLKISFLSIEVSGSATLISAGISLLLVFLIYLFNFPGKKILIILINTGMSIPPVIVGLFVCLLFAREGLFGILNLLYTPYVMIIAQIILVTPIITSITLSAISNLSKNYKLQLLALGANNIQLGYYLLQEIKYQFLIALLVGFGRAISEVGAVMIVGGNIRWLTRVLTTAIVTQARQGEFTYALTLGIILLSLSFGINFFVNLKQQR